MRHDPESAYLVAADGEINALEGASHGHLDSTDGALEGPDRVRAAYPGATWDRVVEIKGRYDPTNLFHLNQNIPLAASDD